MDVQHKKYQKLTCTLFHGKHSFHKVLIEYSPQQKLNIIFSLFLIDHTF